MEKDISKLPAEVTAALNLGAALGENRAFSLIAGRCSAAQAAGLHRVRKDKLYKTCTAQWGEFCSQYLGMSKRHADEMIGLFEEFGPDYFEVAQLTRISAATYRSIACSVRDKAIHIEGKPPIALILENAGQVTAAVAELRRGAEVKSKPGPSRAQRMDTLERQCRDVTAAFAELVGETCSKDEKASLWSMRAKLLVQLDNLKIAA